MTFQVSKIETLDFSKETDRLEVTSRKEENENMSDEDQMIICEEISLSANFTNVNNNALVDTDIRKLGNVTNTVISDLLHPNKDEFTCRPKPMKGNFNHENNFQIKSKIDPYLFCSLLNVK